MHGKQIDGHFNMLLATDFNMWEPALNLVKIPQILDIIKDQPNPVCLFLFSSYGYTASELYKTLPDNCVVVTMDTIGETVRSDKHLPYFIDAIDQLIEGAEESLSMLQLIENIGSHDEVGVVFHDGQEVSFSEVIGNSL